MSTIKDIAQATGLSHTTVSRILNGKRKESRPTMIRRAEHVRGVARKLGYRPNAAAQATVTGRFHSAALVQPKVAGRSTLPQRLLYEICDALAEHEMSLALARLPDARLTDEQVVPRLLRTHAADGLLVNYTDHIPTKMIELIRGHHIPSIWLNAQLEADCILLDDFGSGRDATEHLLALGHRRIVYADFHPADQHLAEAHYSTHERQAGYEQAMTSAGLTPRVARPDKPTQREDRRAFMRQMLDSPDRPTAIVGYGTREPAVALLIAPQLGLDVPRDLSLVHVSSEAQRSAVELGDVRMTAIWADLAAMAHAAVSMLLDKIAAPDTPLTPCRIPFHWKDRGDTTGPVPGQKEPSPR